MAMIARHGKSRSIKGGYVSNNTNVLYKWPRGGEVGPAVHKKFLEIAGRQRDWNSDLFDGAKSGDQCLVADDRALATEGTLKTVLYAVAPVWVAREEA